MAQFSGMKAHKSSRISRFPPAKSCFFPAFLSFFAEISCFEAAFLSFFTGFRKKMRGSLDLVRYELVFVKEMTKYLLQMIKSQVANRPLSG